MERTHAVQASEGSKTSKSLKTGENISSSFHNDKCIDMGVRKGAKGGSCPPDRLRPAKNSMVLDFFKEKIVCYLVFWCFGVLQKVYSCPLPMKKSADAHANSLERFIAFFKAIR